MFDISPNKRKRRSNFDLSEMVNEFFGDGFLPGFDRRWMRVDIKDTETEYVLEAELPGINKEDININIEDEVLTINVSHDESTEDKTSNFIRKERRFGKMTRAFNIPDIDKDNINAKFDNGVLILRLPKAIADEQFSRKIDIE